MLYIYVTPVNMIEDTICVVIGTPTLVRQTEKDKAIWFTPQNNTPINQSFFYHRIAAAFGNLSSVRFSSILVSVTGDFNTKFDLASLEEFIAQHKDELGAAERSAYKAVDTVLANVDWMENSYQIVIDWLKSQS